MKCEICGKEIKEEESFKGCCKECAKKFLIELRKKIIRKVTLLKKLITKI